MARLNSKLIIKQMAWHANMTEMNHLGKALLLKPTVLESKMTKIFTSERYSDNPLTAMLAGKSEKTIENTEWEWSMKAATTRPLVTIERVEPESLTQPGRGRKTFRLKFDEDWYVPGDIINPGTSDKKYSARIVTAPYKQGKGFVYEVVGYWDDPAMFMPTQFLNPNVQWGKLFSQYGEGSQQSGSIQFSTPIGMRSRMSRYRKHNSVTGDAALQVLAVAIPDSKGGMHKSWMKMAEVEFWEQWYRELERGRWYSRSTDFVKDANGRPIRSGPGIQEYLEDSVQHKYNVLTASLIEEFLMDVFYSRIKPGKQRKISGFTGEYGMMQFSRAIEDWQAKKKGFIQVVDKVMIDKVDSPYHSNALAAGYQYVRYRMLNGAELELTHNPLYDDREINWQIDPITGYPVESQRITFLDFKGESDGGNNIVLMDKKNSFKMGYIPGLTTPYGPSNGDMMAHAGDYYEMHVQKECGIHIHDVTRCGELILDRAL